MIPYYPKLSIFNASGEEIELADVQVVDVYSGINHSTNIHGCLEDRDFVDVAYVRVYMAGFSVPYFDMRMPQPCTLERDERIGATLI